MYHHRGAYLLAMGNVVDATIPKHPKYLWTLPMFHCNGWCFPWSISIEAGTHVCLRKTEASGASLLYGELTVDAFSRACLSAVGIYRELTEKGVTHLCGAPIVMQMLLEAPESSKPPLPLAHTVDFLTAAAPPPPAVLAAMDDMGFDITHVYGLTEIYGPAVINEWQEQCMLPIFACAHRSLMGICVCAGDALDAEQRSALKSRQGVRYSVLEDLEVIDPETMLPTPRDGAYGKVHV